MDKGIEALIADMKSAAENSWFHRAPFTEVVTPQNTLKLIAALEQAQQRNAELEANQQKIESLSSFSDERLKEIERHRENSLLGNLPADLARELRQTRSRLGNYYSLLSRADIAERQVVNLSHALRANGIPVEGSE